jgi:hypothetical protein
MMFCRCASNVAPAATQVTPLKVTMIVPPPSRTSCSVAPSPMVPVTAAVGALCVTTSWGGTADAELLSWIQPSRLLYQAGGGIIGIGRPDYAEFSYTCF